MTDVMQMLQEFHDTFVRPDENLKTVRAKLIAEEAEEVLHALTVEDKAAIAKELADLVYVIYGTALVWDIDLDRVICDVHKSNMTKVGDDGQPVRREDGKILKGPNYRPPDLSWLEEAG